MAPFDAKDGRPPRPSPDCALPPETADEDALTQVYTRRFHLPGADRPALTRRAPLFRSADEAGRAPLPDDADDEEGAPAPPMTYVPARFEEAWLGASLRSFYAEGLITDVLYRVKGGKEANVYCCRAHPRTGEDLLAAKVYRPRRFRSLANDAAYREGRAILTDQGRQVKKSDHRVMRAIGKKTAFGVQVMQTSWLMHEYRTLDTLHAAGGAVPAPLAANENAILMGYLGDERGAAPPLQSIELEPREACALLREVLRNVALLLQHGLVHGDLSAYNLLYWEGRVALIDFPQVASVEGNRQARALLERDVARTCAYFSRQGARCHAEATSAALWARYGASEPPPDLG